MSGTYVDLSAAANGHLSAWLSFFSGAVTMLVGAAIAIFAEPIRQFLFRPRLKVKFTYSDDCVTWTQTTTPNADAVYIRLAVRNVNPRIARDCRAYLTKVELGLPGGSFEATWFVDSLPLSWSCQMPEQERAPIDLPNGVTQYVDIVNSAEFNNSYNIHVLDILRYRNIFEALKTRPIRLTIVVVGSNTYAETISLDVRWNGNWDGLDARIAPSIIEPWPDEENIVSRNLSVLCDRLLQKLIANDIRDAKILVDGNPIKASLHRRVFHELSVLTNGTPARVRLARESLLRNDLDDSWSDWIVSELLAGVRKK